MPHHSQQIREHGSGSLNLTWIKGASPFVLVIIGISIMSRGEVGHVLGHFGQRGLIEVGVPQCLPCRQALVWIVCQQPVQQAQPGCAEVWKLLHTKLL